MARRALPVVWALAVACFAWAAWCFARPAEAAQRPLEVFALDLSLSVERRSPDARAEFGAAIEARLAELEREARGSEVALLAFARTAELWFAPGSPAALRAALRERWPALAPAARAASRVDRALALALGLAREHALERVWLCGDGGLTGSDARAERAELAQRGCRVELIAPSLERADLALAALEVPPRLASGADLPIAGRIAAPSAPLAARVRSAAPPAARARIELEAFDPAGQRGWSRALELPWPSGGEGLPFGASAQLPHAGLWRLRARCTSADAPDACPENDSREAWVRAGASRTLGWIDAGTPARALEPLRARAAAAGFELVALNAQDFAPELGAFDALWTHELRPSALTAAALGDWLAAGGLWLASGSSALLERAPAGSAWEVLPARPLEPAQTRRITLLADASGSMEGERAAALQAAARALLAQAPRGDRIELAFFTTELGAAHELRAAGAELAPAELEARLAAALAEQPPGGGTALYDSVERWLGARALAPGAELLCVLSDGEDRAPAAEREPRARALGRELEQRGVQCCAIALGERGAAEALDSAHIALCALAGARERCLDGRNAPALADALRLALWQPSARPNAAEAQLRSTGGALAAGWWPARVPDFAFDAPPVALRAEPWGEELVELAGGSALVAGRVGRGFALVGALAAAPGNIESGSSESGNIDSGSRESGSSAGARADALALLAALPLAQRAPLGPLELRGGALWLGAAQPLRGAWCALEARAGAQPLPVAELAFDPAAGGYAGSLPAAWAEAEGALSVHLAAAEPEAGPWWLDASADELALPQRRWRALEPDPAGAREAGAEAALAAASAARLGRAGLAAGALLVLLAALLQRAQDGRQVFPLARR